MIVDTGFLVAVERDEPAAWALLDAALERGERPVAPAGVLAQTWRGGPRQARLAVTLLARRYPARGVASGDRGDLERLGVQAGRIIDV